MKKIFLSGILALSLLSFSISIPFFFTGCGNQMTQNEYIESVPNYNTFVLSTGEVSVAISQSGKTLVPLSVLALSSDTTKGIKNSALAMAIGYCVFLKLSDLPADLSAAGATADEIDAIMTGENVNQWLATAFQEMAFDPITVVKKSGYYQIDDEPATVAEGMGSLSTYTEFLKSLRGGAGYVYPAALPPLTSLDERGFVWSSVEKGYYEAKSYIRNKTYYSGTGKPYPDFNLAKWAVNYSRAFESTKYPFETSIITSTAPGELYAFNCLGQVMSYFYNRGQNPFTRYDLPQCKLITDAFGTSTFD
ncbi:MAG: hypothetical protein KKH83_06270, partial [Candidatus Margulisbacteria bacterium]|nr:hypothetical protein [Candidatus Margulisiibacteriota bacterium]